MSLHVPLLDFSDPARSGGFSPIGDPVMGGQSWSRGRVVDGRLVFDGVVSLAAGGGFASIRSRLLGLDLTGLAGLSLRVRGDGRRYKLNLRTDEAFDGLTWQARFDTAPAAWRTVLLPFADFAPTSRGRPTGEAGALDPSHLATVGLLVGDGQAGPFRLEVESLEAFAPSMARLSLPWPEAS